MNATGMAVIWSIVAAALLLAGCGSISQDMFRINEELDRAILSPVNDAYTTILPPPVREGVTNFFDNVGYTSVIINQALQGKPLLALSDTARLAVNTVIGFGGIMDPATELGLEKHDEDLGQTLGVHGFGPGPYFVMPLLGPTTVRDFTGTLASSFIKPYFYLDRPFVAPEDVLQLVNRRALLSDALELIREADDPYEFMKEAYLARRRFLVYDGDPPVEDLEKGLEGLEDLEDLDEEDLEDLEDLDEMDDEGLEDLDDELAETEDEPEEDDNGAEAPSEAGPNKGADK